MSRREAPSRHAAPRPERVGGPRWRAAASGPFAFVLFAITGLMPTTGASFTAKTYGSGTLSTASSFAPTAPTGVNATAGTGQVTVSWSSVAGATTYTVQYRVQGGGSWTVESPAAGLSSVITGLAGGTTYVFQVRANNYHGSSAWEPGTPATATVPVTTPLIVSHTTNSVLAATSIAGTKPPAVSNGDLLLAALANDDAGSTLTAPAGWTLVRKQANGSVAELATYRKVVTNAAGEPASYTFTSSSADDRALTISRITGADTTTPVDAVSGGAASGTSATAASVTTAGTNRLLYALVATNNGGDTLTVPAGMTERYQYDAGPSGPTTVAAYATQAATGASGNKVFAITSGSTMSTSILIAIRPQI